MPQGIFYPILPEHPQKLPLLLLRFQLYRTVSQISIANAAHKFAVVSTHLKLYTYMSADNGHSFLRLEGCKRLWDTVNEISARTRRNAIFGFFRRFICLI